jgi:tryptophan-rich sensory protein
MILLGFLWYPLFFVAARFALSALLCLAVIGLCVLCGLCFWSVSRIFGSLLLLHALYLFSLFFRLLTILVA